MGNILPITVKSRILFNKKVEFFVHILLCCVFFAVVVFSCCQFMTHAPNSIPQMQVQIQFFLIQCSDRSILSPRIYRPKFHIPILQSSLENIQFQQCLTLRIQRMKSITVWALTHVHLNKTCHTILLQSTVLLFLIYYILFIFP